MKRIVTGLMMAVWLSTMIIGGCQKESTVTPTPTSVITVDNAKVTVLNYQADAAKRTITFALQIAWLDGSSEQTTFRIGMFENVDGQNGVSATLSDQSKLLWNYTSSIDVATESIVSITEKSTDDLLTLTAYEQDGIRTEIYTDRLGQSITFEIPAGLSEKILNKATLTSKEAELANATYAKFRSFYSGSSSLENNRYGFLVNALMNSRLLTDIVPRSNSVGKLASQEDNVPDWEKKLCNLCKACALIKCWFGGPANSLCAACTGCVAACYLADFICDIFGW
jgi:outer membrane murein-binding lipoprotein Lpp